MRSSLLLFFVISNYSFAKIGIISYGSLVKWQKHSITGAQLKATPFIPVSIYFPISLSLLANTNRITAVVDVKEGVPKRIWIAESNFKNFDTAMQNLAAREGAYYDQKSDWYDSSRLFYIKKVAIHYHLKNDEEYISSYPEWIVRNDSNPRQQLCQDSIHQLIQWAISKNYTAMIWTSCPIVILPLPQFLERLITDPLLLKNAQNYINALPDGADTQLEKAILAGKKSLSTLYNLHLKHKIF